MGTATIRKLAAVSHVILLCCFPVPALAGYILLDIGNRTAPDLTGGPSLIAAEPADALDQIENLQSTRWDELSLLGPDVGSRDQYLLDQWLTRHYQWAKSFGPLRQTSRRLEMLEAIHQYQRRAASQARPLRRVGMADTRSTGVQPVLEERVELRDLLLEASQLSHKVTPMHLLDNGAGGEEPGQLGTRRVSLADLVLGTQVSRQKVLFSSYAERGGNISQAAYAGTDRSFGRVVDWVERWERESHRFKGNGGSTRKGMSYTQAGAGYLNLKNWGNQTRIRSGDFLATKKKLEPMSLLTFVKIIVSGVAYSPLTYIILTMLIGFWLFLRTVGGTRA